MAATIRTDLTDNSQEWSQNLKAAMRDVGSFADQTAARFEKMTEAIDAPEITRATDNLRALAAASSQVEAQFTRTTRRANEQTREFRELDKAVSDAADQTGKLDREISELNADFDPKKAAAYRRELEATSDAMARGPAQAKSSWLDFIGKMSLATSFFGSIQSLAAGAGQAISAMSDAGVPGAVKLTDSFSRVGERMLNFANRSEAVEKSFRALTLLVDNVAAPVLEQGAKLFARMGETAATVAENVSLLLGLEWEKNTRELERIQQLEKDKETRQARAAARAEQTNAAIQEQSAIRDSLEAAAESRRLQKRIDSIKSAAVLEDQLWKERSDLNWNLDQAMVSAHLAAEKNLKDDFKAEAEHNAKVAEFQAQAEKHAQVILALEQKKAEFAEQERIEKEQAVQDAADLLATQQELEHATRMRDNFEKTSKILGQNSEKFEHFRDLQEQVNKKEEAYLSLLKGPIKDEEERRIKRAREQREADREAAEERLKAVELEKKAAEEAHRIKMQDAQAEMDKFKSFVEQNLPGFMGGNGGGGGFGGPGGQAGGGFGGGFGGFPKKIGGTAGLSQNDLMTLQKFRVDDALQKFEKQDKVTGEYKQDSKGNIIRDKNGTARSLDKGQQKAQRMRNIGRVKREARMQFRRDAVTGGISNQEIAKAGAKLRDAAVEKIKQDGNVNEAEANLLQGLVDGLNEAAAQQAQMADQLNAMLGGLQGVPGVKVGKSNKAMKAVP